MKLKKTYKALLALGVAGSMLMLADAANASAFQLFEQDSAGLGSYHAGWAVNPNDSASAGYYNPAALTLVKGQQVTAGGVGIQTNMKFKGTVDIGSGPQRTTANGGVFRFVPNFSYAAPINDKLVLAFSAVTPFGLATVWPTDNIVANYATKTSMMTFDLTPSFGYKLNKYISIGAGLDIEYMKATFDNFIFDSIRDRNSGDDWGYGYHVGMLVQPDDSDRLGISFKSQIRHHLRGTGKFTGAPSTRIKSDITLPPTLAFSYMHIFNQHWTAMATATYTQWSVIQQIKLSNLPTGGGGPSQQSIPQDYKNTWNFALGGQYHLNQRWTFQAGIGYDQTPTVNKDRNLRLPDGNRYATAIGARYAVTKNIFIDAGYLHLFITKAKINNPASSATPAVKGNTYSDANLFGLQFTWNIT